MSHSQVSQKKVSFTLNSAHSTSPSIPQTPYIFIALFIPCLNFDPTHQVILQKENACKRVSPQQKNDPRKKREKEQGSKVKEVKPHLPIQGHEKVHEKTQRG
jgi:hypothetical protein